MKNLRRNHKPWYEPPAPLAVAVFQCRRCHAAITSPLNLVTDTSVLRFDASKSKVDKSLLPAGHYWPVPEGKDFAGQFAVPLASLVGVGYHSDKSRMIGCCGPSGTYGPNRVCSCKLEIGTEQSDCIWTHAVYLDPSKVHLVAPDIEPQGEHITQDSPS